MSTTKKSTSALPQTSRKKSLKSYRGAYTEPLPDFLKKIGQSDNHSDNHDAASPETPPQEKKLRRPTIKPVDRPLVRTVTASVDESNDADDDRPVHQNASPKEQSNVKAGANSIANSRAKKSSPVSVQPFPVKIPAMAIDHDTENDTDDTAANNAADDEIDDAAYEDDYDNVDDGTYAATPPTAHQVTHISEVVPIAPRAAQPVTHTPLSQQAGRTSPTSSGFSTMVQMTKTLFGAFSTPARKTVFPRPPTNQKPPHRTALHAKAAALLQRQQSASPTPHPLAANIGQSAASETLLSGSSHAESGPHGMTTTLSLKGKVFIMSRISFIGLLFGLLLLSSLFFAAGFLVALGINPTGTLAGLAAIEKPLGSPGKYAGLPGDKLSGTPESAQPDSLYQQVMTKIMPATAPPAVKTQAETVPVTTDTQQFSIRIEDYSDLAEAKAQTAALDKKGYGSYVVRIPNARGKVDRYSVRLGVFGDYLDASTFSRTLQAEGYVNSAVVIISQEEERFVF